MCLRREGAECVRLQCVTKSVLCVRVDQQSKPTDTCFVMGSMVVFIIGVCIERK